MSKEFTLLLSTTNWNEEWKRLQEFRKRTDDAQYWDKRAKTFTTKDTPNLYVEDFLKLAHINEGETVFDMGCGTGALSVPLGKAGHRVVAGDFSQGMLDQMSKNLEQHDVHCVSPKLISWEEDWDDAGVHKNMVDVCLASRSIATSDLKKALMKLDEVARRRVCLTLSVGASPHTDEFILNALNLNHSVNHDYLYALTILINEGLKPELSYIKSTRKDTFDTHEEAYESLRRMVEQAAINDDGEAQGQALSDLDEWLKDNLIENETVNQLDKKGVAEKRLRLLHPRVVTWAFISWDK